MKVLPNFLIVGASKSGTSSLYHYLRQHPGIFLSDIQKEGRFFSKMPGNFQGPGDKHIDKSITRTLEQYEGLFKGYQKEKAVGDISPEYLWYYRNAIPEILNTLGNEVKIIIVLRNPADRAFSGYTHFVRDKRESLSFEEALEKENERNEKNYIWAWQYKNSGLYFEQVKAYLEHFPHVQVIIYEDFKHNDRKVLSEICAFLGVDPEFRFDTTYKYNVSGQPKNPVLYQMESSARMVRLVKKLLPRKWIKWIKIRWTGEKQMIRTEMSPETRKELIRFFQEDIIKLQKLLGCDLSHWLK